MNRIEKLFAGALQAAGFPYEFWEASREKCIYCGGEAPDFSVKGELFHFSCLPREEPEVEEGEIICGDCCHKHFDPTIKKVTDAPDSQD